jgi:dolichol-phosphate mannosyltransferase
VGGCLLQFQLALARRVAVTGQATLIIVPTYNEGENIGPLLAEIERYAPLADVVVVDDNSSDDTAATVSKVAESNPKVQLLERPGKLGLGTAYLAGFRVALAGGYQRVVTMDADFSHHPRYLPSMLTEAERSDPGLVIGSRYVPGGGVTGWGLQRKVLSKGANTFARTLLRLQSHDCTGGFRCYSRKFVADLEFDAMVSHGYSGLIELLVKVQRGGYQIREVPIVFADRERGQSKISTGEVLRGFTTVLRMRFRRVKQRRTPPIISDQ